MAGVAQQELIERALSGRTPAQRAGAALALAGFHSPETVRALTTALEDPALGVRAAAGTALASLRDPTTTRALARIVAAWSEPGLATSRRSALQALTAFRSEAASVELTRALTAVRPGEPLDLEERSALLAVVYAEPSGIATARVVRTLVATLEKGNGAAADRAASLLELFPAESCRPLARVLRNAASPVARRTAAVALRACRQDTAVAALVAALDDPDEGVRRAAASVLGATDAATGAAAGVAKP